MFKTVAIWEDGQQTVKIARTRKEAVLRAVQWRAVARRASWDHTIIVLPV